MKKNDLYLLIARLSKEEKTYIVKKLSTFKENSVLKALFEDVCVWHTLPKSEIDTLITQKYGKNYRIRRKQLYYAILKILRNYHHTLIHQIHFYILDINLLFEKGLFEQARKLLNKAKKLAERNQIIPLYLELLYLELRMSYYTYYDNLNHEKISQIRKDFLHYHAILQEDIEWSLQTGEELSNFFTYGNITLRNDIPLPVKGHLSFIQQHILAGLIQRNCLNFEKSYHYRSSLWQYFKKYPELISLYPELYLTAVNMVIIGANDLNGYQESLSILEELSTHQHIKAEIVQIEIFRIQSTYYTQIYNFMKDYQKAYTAIEKYTKNSLYQELHTLDKQLLHLHFAVSCLGCRDYHKAIYYCYQILNQKGNTNVMALSMFLLLLSHIMQEDNEAISVIKQYVPDLAFRAPFYEPLINLLTSKELTSKHILKNILTEYEKYSKEEHFVWEKYVNIREIITTLLNQIESIV